MSYFIMRRQQIQRPSRQNYQPGRKLFYGHPRFSTRIIFYHFFFLAGVYAFFAFYLLSLLDTMERRRKNWVMATAVAAT